MLVIKRGFFNIKTTSSAILVSVLIVITIKPKRSEVLQSFAWNAVSSFTRRTWSRICIQCTCICSYSGGSPLRDDTSAKSRLSILW